MTILYITSMSLEKEKHKGNKIHFIEIGKALQKIGNEVVLIAPYYKDQGTRDSYGMVDEQIELSKKGYINYLRFHRVLKKRLKLLLEKYQPELVYSRDLNNG